MNTALLAMSMIATFLGIIYGTRAASARYARFTGRFWLNLVGAVIFAVVSDQINTFSWPTPMQMSQSLEAMQGAPGIFAAFATAALFTAFCTSWCLSYGAGLWNARRAAKLAAKVAGTDGKSE